MSPQQRDANEPETRNDSPKNPIPEEKVSAQVDNAHAAGLGAMGRNDEKLPTGEESTDGPGPEDPAY